MAPTPFGIFYTPNITPDAKTGVGSWSADDFRRALHNGKANGGLLYPTFPYANFTKISRSDVSIIWATLLPPCPFKLKTNGTYLSASELRWLC